MKISLIDFINNIKTDPTFDFEESFDSLSKFDKELIIDILTGFLVASSQFAHDRKTGFKFAYVVLKSRLRNSLINHKLF